MSDSGLRLAYYADDFTGATDALEVLAAAGLRAALFLEVPQPQTLQRHPGLQAIGIAGDSRTWSPAAMDQRLPAALQWLRSAGAPVAHYKVCSTFDSSPAVGSIGRVLRLAQREFGHACMPVVAATPHLARFCAWGNLFARSATDGQVHRIDRHPIMSVHPVTPMREADLCLHLAAQDAPALAKAMVDVVDQGADVLAQRLRELHREGAAAVLVDGLHGDHARIAGEMLLRLGTPADPVFVVGGSGVEDGLVRAWRLQASDTLPPVSSVAQVLAVSGSASALSATQVAHATANGFEDVALDTAALLGDGADAAVRDAASRVARALDAGRSVIAHSVLGPGDARLQAARQARSDAGEQLAMRMGAIVRQVLGGVRMPRLLVSGGDTASAVARALDVQAVEALARLAPGAPLCRVLESRVVPGMEIAFKGGQMGAADYFLRALRGA